MTESDRAIVEESTRLMAVGMNLIGSGEWRVAADLFAEAGRLRDRLPWTEDVECAWMGAASWLNHGDMLLRTGDPALRNEAMASFDKVIEMMAHVPLDSNPAFAERLVLTRLNRAAAWTEDGAFASAMEEFGAAGRAFLVWGEEMTPASRFLSAMLRVNRGRLLIRMQRPLEALDDIHAGLEKLKPLGLSAEVVKARIQAGSLRCRALALLLDKPGGLEKVEDWIAEATDSAEEALRWVRVSGCREDWIADLVRYGARIYQTCQPHFLGEFLGEWLGTDGPLKELATLKTEMRNLLMIAQVEVERKVLALAHETEFVRKQTEVLKSLQRGMASIS